MKQIMWEVLLYPVTLKFEWADKYILMSYIYAKFPSCN